MAVAAKWESLEGPMMGTLRPQLAAEQDHFVRSPATKLASRLTLDNARDLFRIHTSKPTETAEGHVTREVAGIRLFGEGIARGADGGLQAVECVASKFRQARRFAGVGPGGIGHARFVRAPGRQRRCACWQKVTAAQQRRPTLSW